ncbi:hypothetical protein J6590_022451 [Homalodisca vitripennis]|nr:hypothetical protein J6590_022451 [Homalodisca vitripennis]
MATTVYKRVGADPEDTKIEDAILSKLSFRATKAELSERFNLIKLDIQLLTSKLNELELRIGKVELRNDNDFLIHRCDRSMVSSHRRSGGGSLIAIRRGIANKRLHTNLDIECIFVLVTMGLGLGLLIACVYIPPSSPFCVYRDFCDTVNRFVGLSNQPRKILIFGCFHQTYFHLYTATTCSLQQECEYLCDNVIISHTEPDQPCLEPQMNIACFSIFP